MTQQLCDKCGKIIPLTENEKNIWQIAQVQVNINTRKSNSVDYWDLCASCFKKTGLNEPSFHYLKANLDENGRS
jgi:Fe2+ or Zn2+ uptake regulation protein